jgi:thiol:disulfide interchange protein DsbD
MSYFKYIISTTLLLLLTAFYVKADIVKPVKWEKSISKIDETTYEVRFTAKIDEGWHLYGLNIPEDGPIATSFNYSELIGVETEGDISSSVKPQIKFDKTFEMDLELYDGSVSFTQYFKVTRENPSITGFIEFMACDDSRCLPPSEIDFFFTPGAQLAENNNPFKKKEEDVPFFGTQKVDLGSKSMEEPNVEEDYVLTTDISSSETEKEQNNKNRGLLGTLLISLLAGLGALLTPCVYPMIPLTVSFFMRGEKSKSKSVTEALVFGISLVLIYSSLGVLVAIFKNPNAINSVSTHWIPNLLFFGVFIALAVSFFGVFEITLPSGLANKVDQKADKGGVIGAFFMALGMAILSFSCTGPIVASLLIKAAQGEVLEPIVGMFGFSLAFALPFTLLAIFPGVVSKMPKSGGWLNAVKVFFAFILLAFALMFLSNLGLKFITRDLVLALDIVIFTLLGFYLLGKIKFSHDSDLPYVSVPRLMLAIISFAIAVYLVPGLFGSPLKAVSPFLPPQETSEFSMISGKSDHAVSVASFTASELCDETPKYSENTRLHIPAGLKGYFDYEQGMACAREKGKPVLLDFVGHSCKNCKKMYANVWSDPRVTEIINNEYILIVLYTDDRTPLPENEWITSSVDGKVKKTMGKRNVDFEISKFKSNALPLYAALNNNGDVITSNEYFTYNLEVEEFITFLKEGVENYRKS